MYSKELGINFFGSESNKKRQLNKIEILKKNIKNLKIFLIIAGTNTSQIPGISAAVLIQNRGEQLRSQMLNFCLRVLQKIININCLFSMQE